MDASQVEHMTFPRVHMQDESKCEAKFWSHENKTKGHFYKGEYYAHEKI